MNFDVIIIGSGPAGGSCARALSKNNKRVLLIEKLKDFSINSYSSGGAPIEIMDRYELPHELVSSYWDSFALYSTKNHCQWNSTENKGVILDFEKLRKYLAEDAVAHGAELQMHASYLNHYEEKEKLHVEIKDHSTGLVKTIQTTILVDASGTDRAVLGANKNCQSIAATGIEYHVHVDKDLYDQYAKTLSFFLGHHWMPQGYAWVFPIEENRLKIGVVRFFAQEQIVPHHPSLNHYQDAMLSSILGNRKYTVEKRHGKTIVYSYGQKDLRLKKNILALGDSISTLNPLAAEGIRHAMESGELAAHCICSYLENKSTLKSYSSSIDKYCSLKWRACESVMHRIYGERKDQNIDLIVETFKKFSFEELLDLGFGYRYAKFAKFYLHNLYLKLFK